MDSQNRFAQNTDNHRLPTALEKQEGFPCGPLDRELFNKLFNSLQAEIGAVVTDAGLTSTDVTDTWLRDSIRQLISNGRDDFVIWIDASVTYTIGPGGDYPDIRAVMSYLSDFLIADGVTVTLQFTAGVHTYTGDVNITHPTSRNIRFIGANMSAAPPVKSDFTVTGNSVAARASDATTNIAMLRTKYATEIRINGGSLVGFEGTGLIDKLLFVGDGSSNFGLSLTDGTYDLGNISVHGFGKSNVFAINGRLIFTGNVSTTASGQTGFNCNSCYLAPGQSSKAIISYGNAKDGVEFNFETIVSDLSTHTDGNGSLGLSVARNSSAHLSTSVASDSKNNGVHGVQAFFATIDAAGLVSKSNASTGFVASAGGKIIAPSATVSSNGAIGVFSSDDSYIQVTLSNITSNPTNHSPAPNTVGNHHSYVRTI